MNAHPIVNLPRGGPKSEAAHGFVNGMLGKCVRLTVLHMCFSKVSPGRRIFVVFLNDQLGKCVFYCASGGERERTVRRAADSLPGSYFIVLLLLTHPESCLYDNECKP